ncbi:hypothetical protein GQ53DRAFT_293905 [Thozetella sp. PMI_491]|nr:hypothetical protein GQ53DRAFT_293905 [Thozetella sp. PMI_491]
MLGSRAARRVLLVVGTSADRVAMVPARAARDPCHRALRSATCMEVARCSRPRLAPYSTTPKLVDITVRQLLVSNSRLPRLLPLLRLYVHDTWLVEGLAHSPAHAKLAQEASLVHICLFVGLRDNHSFLFLRPQGQI